MPEFLAGTYPYAKRQAIADAVQAVLQLHTQQTEGDVSIRGAVTVLIRVIAPQTGLVFCDEVGGATDEEAWELLTKSKLTPIAPEVARGCATKVEP